MIAINFILGFVLYCLATALSYSNQAKSSTWYFPLGLLLGLGINFLWLHIAKTTLDGNILIKYAFYWDVMAVLIYAIIPLLFFKILPSTMTLTGLALIIIGLILTKVG